MTKLIKSKNVISGIQSNNELKSLGLDDLARWIAGKWSKPFEHSYSLEKTNSPVWEKWRSLHPESPHTWACSNLSEAAKHYSWTSGEPDFDCLSTKIKKAISCEAGDEVANICLAIFKWGGVARSQGDYSRKWIKTHQDNKTLIAKISQAVELLQPNCQISLTEFNGSGLLMNSAMTKVYAAADQLSNVVMYDGRVGAALGLLTRKMLAEHSVKKIPDSLAFRWGAPSSMMARQNRTRDPSDCTYSFQILPNTSSNKQADLIRATLSRNLNYLTEKITSIVSCDGERIKAVELERALFMLGFNVRNS